MGFAEQSNHLGRYNARAFGYSPGENEGRSIDYDKAALADQKQIHNAHQPGVQRKCASKNGFQLE